MNNDFDDLERLARSPWLAGALGGLVGLRFAPGLSWAERASNVLCGALCAGYGSPAITEWLAISSHGMQAAMSFVVGMFGLSVAAEAMRGFRELGMGDILRERLRGWLEGRKP